MLQHVGTIRDAASTSETLPGNSGATWGERDPFLLLKRK